MTTRQSIVFGILILLIPITAQALTLDPQVSFLRLICSGDAVPKDGTFANDLLFILSNLGQMALEKSKLFATNSTGKVPDQVNALSLCRPDLSVESCQTCVWHASEELQKCHSKEGVVWYDECMVRYSNKTIFATVDIKAQFWSWSLINVTQPDNFPSLLNGTMESLIAKAVTSPEKSPVFAMGNTSFTLFEGLYTLALCTPDITRSQCELCLRSALQFIPGCCGRLAQWTSVFSHSCQLRYDTAPFISGSPTKPWLA